ncbi:MAG: DUF1080 domain-containing protein [Planctomycetaceae bacterium]|nr:DUF1080 domain-containing protein [Planctomycetaceae bacterium]
MALSLQNFVDQLAGSSLMSRQDIAAVVDGLPAAERPQNAEQLARLLVHRKRLTAFQAQQCFSGKGKSLVLGNYVLLDKLGQGGMGMVLKAQHKRMKRIVALKVLAPNVSKDPALVARFHREVEAAAKLTHPNIVAAYDADEANNTSFLVMEFVEGTDLSSLVKKKGPLPIEQSIQCILQAAKGLEYAHRQGVVHRDIKPANIFVRADASVRVKILDMGLARIEGETAGKAELTSTGAVMGTVDYMAPEQALSTKHADARSDIYSLGATLFELITRRPAYDGDSLMARLLAHRDAPIPSLMPKNAPANSAIVKWTALDEIFRKMVAKKPEDRFQSMTEVVAALEACQRGDSATPSMSVGPTEDSRLDNFLANLDTTPPPSDGTFAAPAGSPTAVTRPLDPANGLEATITTSDSDVPTDPQTLTRLPQGKLPPRVRKSPRSKASPAPAVWWRDRRLHWGAAAVGALLLMLIVFRRGSDTPASPPVVAASAALSPPPVSVATPQSGSDAIVPPAEPDNWETLFDGQLNPSAWKTLGSFEVKDGLLVSNAKGVAVTQDTYSDFDLEFEWRLASGGNSGLYYRTDAAAVKGQYSYPGTEFQLLDNQRHADGKNPKTSAGSLYGVVAPKEDATHPAGEWNTSRVVARGGRVEHWVNGQNVLTYDMSSPEWATALAGAKNDQIRTNVARPSGEILLQGHTSEIAFRRIRVRRFEIESARTSPEDGLRFSGTNDYVELANLEYDGKSPWTIEAVVTVSSKQKNPLSVLISTNSRPGTKRWISLFLQDDQLGIYRGYNPTTTATFDRPIVVAGVRDGPVQRLYIDGKKVAESQTDRVVDRASLLIGSEVDSQYCFTGTIHELRISDKARYTKEYVATFDLPSDADTRALYKFDEGAGTVLHDTSGHGHDGKIIGATWVQSRAMQ